MIQAIIKTFRINNNIRMLNNMIKLTKITIKIILETSSNSPNKTNSTNSNILINKINIIKIILETNNNLDYITAF